MATFPLHRVFTLLATLGAVALLVVTWSKVVATISSPLPVPPKSQPQPQAIVWDGRVFQDQATLARRLRAEGTSYRVWSRKHPRSAAIIEHRKVPPAPAKTTPKKTEPVKRAAPTPTPAHAGTSSTSRVAVPRDAVYTLLLLLALLLAAAAAPPVPLRRRFPALMFRIAHYRGALAATAAAIVVGIAVSVGLN